jgi:hypothetical protein
LAILLDSPFRDLDRIGVIERRQTPLEAFVDRALSKLSVSPDWLVARADELAREAQHAMAGLAWDGVITEVVRSQAFLALREQAAGQGGQ